MDSYREAFMNPQTYLDKTGRVLPLPPHLSFRAEPSRPLPRPRQSNQFALPELTILPSASRSRSEDLYGYATRTQQRLESSERLAFAVMAGSGIAGIISAFI